MAYKIKWSKTAEKQFNKLDKPIRERINEYLEKVANSKNPKAFAKSLRNNYSGLCSFRVADKYRIIAEIQDDKLIIYIVSVGKREIVYDDID